MKIAVLLSGGVDSSVALKRVCELREGRSAPSERHDVTAYYLKIWLEDELAFLGECPWEEDLAYARAVCEQLGVPLRIIPLQQDYQHAVIAHTVSELKAGRTPSPDIVCNQRIKFGLFIEQHADGVDCVVSGHYAQVERLGDRVLLKRAPDPVKDQTYFLSALSQTQLKRVWFPLGCLTKKQVRAEARSAGLATQDRKDSQGICFLGKIHYADFVRSHLGECAGTIVERESGTTLGQHRGYWFYTIGQRQGLGLSGGPWYVVEKDIERNIVRVSHQEAATERGRRCFALHSINWIAGAPPDHADLMAKVRHGPTFIRCRVDPTGPDSAAVELVEADRGIAPGQSAVLYDGDICLGGGVIT